VRDVPLVALLDCRGIDAYGILDLTFRHRFVLRASGLRFQSFENEISFALPKSMMRMDDKGRKLNLNTKYGVTLG
jgi:hypothetical protein